MPVLHSVVCVKIVPKSEEIRVDTTTRLLERRGVRTEINPPDMNALEIAFGLKDQYGGRVDILSMGPLSFIDDLRVGLLMAADHVYLLSDRLFGGADTLATTYTLSKAINKIGGVDIVLCGEESADGATGQVPPGLAEWLNWSQLTLVSKIDIEENLSAVCGRREVTGGYEILRVPLPCVVSVKSACNEPRFMDYRRRNWANHPDQVTVWGAKNLDVDIQKIGLSGSPTRVTGLFEAQIRGRRRQIIEGDDDEKALRLVEIFRKYMVDNSSKVELCDD